MQPVIWMGGAPLSDAARFSISLLPTISGHWLLPIINTRSGLTGTGSNGAMTCATCLDCNAVPSAE